MPLITIIDSDGAEYELSAVAGETLMQVATRSGLQGVVAECGGNLICATCHVYLDEQSAARFEPPGEQEDDMLGFTAADRLDTSRLSCQLVLSEQHEGVVATVAPRQF